MAYFNIQHGMTHSSNLLNNSCNICWSTNVEPCVTGFRVKWCVVNPPNKLLSGLICTSFSLPKDNYELILKTYGIPGFKPFSRFTKAAIFKNITKRSICEVCLHVSHYSVQLIQKTVWSSVTTLQSPTVLFVVFKWTKVWNPSALCMLP